ncbi:MAG: nuclear transport factor 2 family protein [Actinomycetota bacterium]|nr:nuclear transport factor 2 family protein [Actinomycetota bacterium]
MEENPAKELIDKYIKAWKEKDLNLFLSVLHNQVEVRECTGVIYQGKEILKKWFIDWNQGTNKVIHWEINSFGFDVKKSIAFIEWEFKCSYENKEHAFEGSSITYFKDELIFRINEYGMKLEKSYPYK